MHSTSSQAASRSKHIPTDCMDGLLTLTEALRHSNFRKAFPTRFSVRLSQKLRQEPFFLSVLVFNGNDTQLTSFTPATALSCTYHSTGARSAHAAPDYYSPSDDVTG